MYCDFGSSISLIGFKWLFGALKYQTFCLPYPLLHTILHGVSISILFATISFVNTIANIQYCWVIFGYWYVIYTCFTGGKNEQNMWTFMTLLVTPSERIHYQRLCFHTFPRPKSLGLFPVEIRRRHGIYMSWPDILKDLEFTIRREIGNIIAKTCCACVVENCCLVETWLVETCCILIRYDVSKMTSFGIHYWKTLCVLTVQHAKWTSFWTHVKCCFLEAGIVD